MAEINFKNISAYLNDGKGTPVSRLTLKALTFDISKDSTITSNYKSDIDITPPEKFDIVMAKDISIENNKYFVSFFAVDKGSGLARYEVEEKPLVISLFGYKKVWLDVKNLQVLEYQNWPSIIYVRAYDQAGNVTEENIYKFNNYIYYTLALLLFVLIIINIKKWYNEKVKAKI